MSKIILVIDEDKLPAKIRYWLADAVFELTDTSDGFFIEKNDNVYYDEQRVCPLLINDLLTYLPGRTP